MACSPLFLFPVCNWRSKEQFVYLRMSSVRLRLPYEPVSGLARKQSRREPALSYRCEQASGLLLIPGFISRFSEAVEKRG